MNIIYNETMNAIEDHPLGWRLNLCQFPTSCSGNGSKKARKMAYLAMQ